MATPLRRPRRPRFIIIGVAIVVFLILLGNAARFYTDVLWFNEVGYSSVLWTSLRTQFLVGVVVGLVFGGLVWANIMLAARLAPPYVAIRFSDERRDPLADVRGQIRPYLKWIAAGIALLIAFFAGAAASSTWRTYLLWANGGSFGATDPQFHKDIGFFVFDLPFYSDILGWLWGALFLSLIISAAAHYLFGSFDPTRGWRGVAPRALAHLSVLLGLLALVKAAQYWLGRYSLDFSPRGVVTGASYTDVHAQLPALTLLAGISVVSALLFLANIRVRRLTLPLAAVAIWVLIAVLAGGVWPFFVQQFSVKPQELQREAPYIKRNIEATRTALGLDNVKTQSFPAASDLTGSQVQDNQDLLANVRLWDPSILAQAYQQLQAIQLFYDFPDVDVDRYQIGGQERQVLLSAREISLADLPSRSRTWPNIHLRYTHGYGLVASLANEATSAGEPDFLVKDVPPVLSSGADSLKTTQPRVYYGETFQPDDYSIVNSHQAELDYPTNSGTANFHYGGSGGIEIGGIFKRVAFALREGDPNLILSSLIEPSSRILIYRNVRDRVHRAAPFLQLDGDPYPAVVDGHLEWILDAYTSTDMYPYSQRFDVSTMLTSSVDDTDRLEGRVNYIRNSVKVVIDAYTGKMTFYTVPGVTDPLLDAWKKAFPALFTTAAPPQALQQHFRYPEDLFAVQSKVYTTYHMSTAPEFYSKRDQWAIPQNAQNLGSNSSLTSLLPTYVPPTYLLFRLPGQSEQEFLLSRPYTPRNRRNMVAQLVARNDAPNYGQLVALHFGSQQFVQGPQQVDNLINQDVQVSRTISLLSQQGSRVEFGSLVILPVENSLLYIQPMFVTATNVGIPELKKVVVVLGQRVVMEDDFPTAIRTMFGLAATTPGGGKPGGGGAGGKQGGGGGGGKVGPTADRVTALLDRADRLYQQAQEALQQGDLGRYARLVKQIGELITKAKTISHRSLLPTPSPTSSP